MNKKINDIIYAEVFCSILPCGRSAAFRFEKKAAGYFPAMQ